MLELPTGITLRDYEPADERAVLAINEANVPEVGPLDAVKLAAFTGSAWWMPVVEREGEVVGFAILLVEGAPYESPNYLWFADRHERFAYVDRIAMSAGARSLGVGGSIYREAQDRARRERRDVLCAEVNTIPPNEGSQRFHARHGFEEVGRLSPYGPDAEVAMLECRLDRGAGAR